MHDLATIQAMNAAEMRKRRGRYGKHNAADPYEGYEDWELELLGKLRGDARHWNGFVRSMDDVIYRDM